jgi:nitroreductase
MNNLDFLKKRRSVRKFVADKPITDKQIKILLEAASLAPSAGNRQSWFFYLVQDKKIKTKLTLAAFGQLFITQAPLVIVACADLKRAAPYGKKGKELFAVQDATLAIYNLWLAAVQMGLGAVWVGAFSQKLVAKILKLPKNLLPIAILPLGYPASLPKAHSRRPIKEIFREIC